MFSRISFKMKNSVGIPVSVNHLTTVTISVLTSLGYSLNCYTINT